MTNPIEQLAKEYREWKKEVRAKHYARWESFAKLAPTGTPHVTPSIPNTSIERFLLEYGEDK